MGVLLKLEVLISKQHDMSCIRRTPGPDRRREESVASSSAVADTQCPECGQWCVGDFGLTQHQETSKKCLAFKYWNLRYAWADALKKASQEWKKRQCYHRRAPKSSPRLGRRDRRRSKSRHSRSKDRRGRSRSREQLRKARPRTPERRPRSPTAEPQTKTSGAKSRKEREKKNHDKKGHDKVRTPPPLIRVVKPEASQPEKGSDDSDDEYSYTASEEKPCDKKKEQRLRKRRPKEEPAEKKTKVPAVPKAVAGAAPKTAAKASGQAPAPIRAAAAAGSAQDSHAANRMEAMAAFLESQAKLLRQ